jgi:hypothetical protein
MRYYVYATHTDDTRNRPQRRTFRTTRPGRQLLYQNVSGPECC